MLPLVPLTPVKESLEDASMQISSNLKSEAAKSALLKSSNEKMEIKSSNEKMES